MSALTRLVWVTVGKTDHQAWLLEDLDDSQQSSNKQDNPDGVLIRWETTGDVERVPRSSIHLEMPSSRRRRRVSGASEVVVTKNVTKKTTPRKVQVASESNRTLEKEGRDDLVESWGCKRSLSSSGDAAVTERPDQVLRAEPSTGKKRKVLKSDTTEIYPDVQTRPEPISMETQEKLGDDADMGLPSATLLESEDHIIERKRTSRGLSSESMDLPAVESKETSKKSIGALSIAAPSGNESSSLKKQPLDVSEKDKPSKIDSFPQRSIKQSQSQLQLQSHSPSMIAVNMEDRKAAGSVAHNVRKSRRITDRKTIVWRIASKSDSASKKVETVQTKATEIPAGEASHTGAGLIRNAATYLLSVSKEAPPKQKRNKKKQQKVSKGMLRLELEDGKFTKTQLRVFDELLTGKNQFTPRGKDKPRNCDATSGRSGSPVHQLIIDRTPDSTAIARQAFTFSRHAFYSLGHKGGRHADELPSTISSETGCGDDFSIISEGSVPPLLSS